MEPGNRAADFRLAALKLEDRYLKDRKHSEQAWFAEDAAAMPAAGEAALELNRKLKANHQQRQPQSRRR